MNNLMIIYNNIKKRFAIKVFRKRMKVLCLHKWIMRNGESTGFKELKSFQSYCLQINQNLMMKTCFQIEIMKNKSICKQVVI